MSTMKKMIAISLTGVMLMGSASMVVSADSAEGKAYSDVKSTNWAYESIEAISQKGLIQGYPDGKFKPSGTLSYGEFIKMVLLADHSRKDKSSNDNWKDPGNAVDETGKLAVDPNTGNKKHWAQNYYDEALKRHYFLPTQIGVSQLAGQISRGDMALVISSALGEVKIERYDEIQSAIQDVTSKTKHEYDIIKAYATGVLTGYGDHTFRPEATLTRAESATVLWRLIDERQRQFPKNKEQAMTTGSGVLDGTSPGAVDMGSEDKNVTENGSSKKPADVISNLDFDEYTQAVTSYTLVKDPTPYRLKLKENRGTKWMDSIGLGLIYLVKNKKIIESVPLGANFEKVEGYAEPVKVSKAIYETDITKADHILSVHGVDKTMILIVNPFKK